MPYGSDCSTSGIACSPHEIRQRDAARQCVLRWYEPLLNSLSHGTNMKDPKTQLQEYLQSCRLPLPVYTVMSVEGESHQQTFVVSCSVASISQNALGKGSSRRRAEQDAAETMLRMIKK